MQWRAAKFCRQIGFAQFLGLLLGLSVPVTSLAEKALPPLLKQSKILSCAQTEPRAKQALSRLWEIEDSEKEFPDENMQGSNGSILHAATLDIVLKSLVDTAERFPLLRNQVERTLLKWNYCDVFQEGSFYDLKKSSSGFERSKAAANSPQHWQGFKALGFLGEHENRFIPNILALDQQSLRSDYEWLFHRIFREQCFPHPDTSALFDSTQYRLKESVAVTVKTTVGEYPHEWNPECVYPRSAPKLTTDVAIEDIPSVVPALISELRLLPVPQLVPGLLTQVKLVDQSVVVPVLKSKINIQDVPQLVPELKTKIVMSQLELKVPVLKSRLLLEPTRFAAPKLSTRIHLDKPKVIVKKPLVKKAPIRFVARGGNHNGNYTGNYRKGNNHTNAQIAARQQVVTKQQVATKPSIVLDKNASLMERVLGGLSGGGNVLIVDKIQLTVNEYNGTVETVISSSDIGSTVTATETKPELVRELLQALPVSQKPAVSRANNSAIKKRPKKSITQSSAYVMVPELQSMLLVTQIEATSRRPVQIPDKTKRVTKSKSKTRIASKRKKPAKRNKKGSTSSSLFIYEPYPNGKPAEKSIEQLLLEYQAYEERRKSGRKPKKKRVDRTIKKLLDVPMLNPQILLVRAVSKKRDVPSLRTKYWIEKRALQKVSVPELNSKVRVHNRAVQKVNVPGLNSIVRIYKKYKTRTVKVPSLSPMVIQQLPAIKESTKQSSTLSSKKLSDEVFEDTTVQGKVPEETFKFSNDRLPDHVFESTLVTERTTSAATTPTFLSSDAPLPYVIDELFRNDLPTALPGSKKAKDKQKKRAKPKKKTIGLAGNIYLKHSLRHSAEAIGGSINRKLIKDSYWFARVGWNYTLETSDDPFTYSWGIGYSDWHPGTFSAQLNNWGPIKPEQGLALEKAVANFGYSVKSDFLKKHRLGLSGSINVPVEGNSSIAGNLRWSPIENWYINTSVSHPLEGDGTPKWTYGFGYSDWRPNKVNLQYSNYGPNEILDDNYEENGTWSLSYNWKF